MRIFLTSRFLFPVILVLLINCRLGDLYSKRRRLDNNGDNGQQSDGHGNKNKKEEESGREPVMLGVPILYEQRKYVAKELGIDPRLIMGNMQDYVFRDRYPEKQGNDLESEGKSLLSGGGSPALIRMKRGIIWNKIQKVKKGIQRVQKKLVNVKNSIRKLIKGNFKNKYFKLIRIKGNLHAYFFG